MIPDHECFRQENAQQSWSSASSTNHSDKIEDVVIPFERNLCGHRLAGLLWERRVEEILWRGELEKCHVENDFMVTENLNYSCTR